MHPHNANCAVFIYIYIHAHVCVSPIFAENIGQAMAWLAEVVPMPASANRKLFWRHQSKCSSDLASYNVRNPYSKEEMFVYFSSYVPHLLKIVGPTHMDTAIRGPYGLVMINLCKHAEIIIMISNVCVCACACASACVCIVMCVCMCVCVCVWPYRDECLCVCVCLCVWHTH